MFGDGLVGRVATILVAAGTLGCARADAELCRQAYAKIVAFESEGEAAEFKAALVEAEPAYVGACEGKMSARAAKCVAAAPDVAAYEACR